ncbi:unknow [Vibrio campbellii]|nr:unknow [Vibrio campbellii]
MYKLLQKQRISELSFAQKLNLKNDTSKPRLTSFNLEIHF